MTVVFVLAETGRTRAVPVAVGAWIGSAYCWFFAATLAATKGWDTTLWNGFANFNGVVGVIAMVGSLALTIYSLVLYMRSYGRVFRRSLTV